MTAAIPLPENPDYRKDLHEGDPGTVVGWADSSGKKIMIKMKVQIPGRTGKKEIIHICNPGNMMLTCDYQMQKASGSKPDGDSQAGKGKPTEKTKDTKPKADPPCWVLDSDPDDVELQDDWLHLTFDFTCLCDETKRWFCNSRVAVGLENLYMSGYIPSDYSKKDLHVVTRNKNGVKTTEVWTAKDFEAEKLIFAPMTNCTRVSHMQSFNHAIVDLPKRGRGNYPGEITDVGLDGRHRSIMCGKGSLQSASDVKGCLFWTIGRTSKIADANMSFETIHWNMNIDFVMPRKKAKTTTSWVSTELPGIPILINKKAIPKGIRLVAFQREKQNNGKKC